MRLLFWRKKPCVDHDWLPLFSYETEGKTFRLDMCENCDLSRIERLQ